jgi:ribosomal protein L37AE/L43A
MAWIKQKKDEHVCPKPQLNGAIKPDPGDVWQCDKCGLNWTVRQDWRDGLFWVMAVHGDL